MGVRCFDTGGGHSAPLDHSVSVLASVDLVDSHIMVASWRRAAADCIPGPIPLPLLGNSIRAFRNRTQLHKLLSDEKYRKYGPIVRVWLVGMMVR